MECYRALGREATMYSTRLRRKPARVLAAAQPRPRWQTQMRRETEDFLLILA